MHELSICKQIVNQVNDIAQHHQAAAIESVSLKIGPLSGVEAPLLKQAFPFAAADTVAENAELIIEHCFHNFPFQHQVLDISSRDQNPLVAC